MVTHAPGALRVVESFVNTAELGAGEDALAYPGAVHAWLAAEGLLEQGAPARRGDAAKAVALREALRAALAANNGAGPDPAAIAVLDEAARRGRVALRFDAGARAILDAGAPGLDGALGRLLAIVAAAHADGTWPNLKACRSEGCRYVFWDATRNHSRAWCEMAVCGNRAKARAYRERHPRA